MNFLRLRMKTQNEKDTEKDTLDITYPFFSSFYFSLLDYQHNTPCAKTYIEYL